MDLQLWQWAFGAAAAFLVGLSKTGIPGLGILVVLLLAAVFGGRASIGIMLPMLIIGDCFALAWYRQHARWEKLVGVLPWIVVGMGLGAAALWLLGRSGGERDTLSVLIGALVFVMLCLHALNRRTGERFAPTSIAGVSATGIAAGFATTVANAAGPIMSIYMLAHKLAKNQFMGTLAWYYFIFNVSKLPVYFALSAMEPTNPIIGLQSLTFVMITAPAIVIGALVGRWVLPRIPEKGFESVVLVLSGASAAYLIARSL